MTDLHEKPLINVQGPKSLDGLRETKVFIIGSGIAGLASAAYFIRDGKIPGDRISILEQLGVTGGSLDASGSPATGYSLRGGRMFTEEAYTCTYDLLSAIPSLDDPAKSLRTEFIEFNKTFRSNSRARLVDKNRNIVDASHLGLNLRDKLTLTKILVAPEKTLGEKRISDCFSAEFFQSNFWFLWATTFAFQPWHSAAEFRRYTRRFLDEFPRLHNLGGVRRTPLNQYDAIVLPLTQWLKGQGVRFMMNTRVTDLLCKTQDRGAHFVERIIYNDESAQNQEIELTDHDFVVATVGSMTESSDCGSMSAAPRLKSKQDDGSWTFWDNIAKNHPEFGHPSVFTDRIAESKWESFTMTFKDPTFFRLMKDFSDNEPGTGGLVTFKDSAWLMSIVLPRQPYFRNQASDTFVAWGYGLFPDREGNFIRKKMSDCNGQEIMLELLNHLEFLEHEPTIMANVICIPCMMPFITSQFLTRSSGDRPNVVPKGYANLALVGQFSEIPDDTVFTVDYSVRGAQIAVYSLLNLAKEITPIHKGQYNPRTLYRAAQTLWS